eukprot:777492-Amphidinium_carterae.1
MRSAGKQSRLRLVARAALCSIRLTFWHDTPSSAAELCISLQLGSVVSILNFGKACASGVCACTFSNKDDEA